MANGLAALLGASKPKTEEVTNAQAEKATPPAAESPASESPQGEANRVANAGAVSGNGSALPQGGKFNPFAKRVAAADEGPESQAGDLQPVREAVVDSAAAKEANPPVTPSPLSKLAGLKLGASTTPTPSPASTQISEDISLEDLAGIQIDDDIAPVRSSFADETPATAPTRTLPENLTKQQSQFIDLIDGVYTIVHDHELIGGVITSIMIELKANPQYAKLIHDDDVRLWVRSMRNAMGLAVIKKIETKAKRASGGTSRGKKVDADMMEDLASLGIEL